MKYICKRNCYVRNPQGVLQHYREGETADYPAGSTVAEHFECAGSAGAHGAQEDEDESKTSLRRKLKELKVSCPPNAGIETMRRKIAEAEAGQVD